MARWACLLPPSSILHDLGYTVPGCEETYASTDAQAQDRKDATSTKATIVSLVTSGQMDGTQGAALIKALEGPPPTDYKPLLYLAVAVVGLFALGSLVKR